MMIASKLAMGSFPSVSRAEGYAQPMHIISDQRGQQKAEGGEPAHRPDYRTPRGEAEGVGGDIGDAGDKVGVGEGGGRGGRLAREGDDRNGEGEEDQPFEMVVHRALQAGGEGGRRAFGRAVAGGGG